MPHQYAVVALSPVHNSSQKPEDSLDNTRRIIKVMDTAVAEAATEGGPVKLVIIPEMAIQGMTMNFGAGNHGMEKDFARIVPGPETDLLGQAAKRLNAYIAGELYLVSDDDFPDGYFNVGFLIDPNGEVIYRRATATSEGFEPGILGATNPPDRLSEGILQEGAGRLMDPIYPWRTPPTSATSAPSSVTRARVRTSHEACH